jgi:hypothetical protein
MDHRVAPGDCAGQARWVRDVALRERRALLYERFSTARVPNERANVVTVVPQRLYDVAADESGGAGDEDHSKFL